MITKMSNFIIYITHYVCDISIFLAHSYPTLGKGVLDSLFYMPRVPMTADGSIDFSFTPEENNIIKEILGSDSLMLLDIELGTVCDSVCYVSDHYQRILLPDVHNWTLLKKHCNYLLII